MIDKLKSICNKKIELNKNNIYKLERYKYIQNILNNKTSFMKLTIEEVYSILRDLDIEENDYLNVYKLLIEQIV